MLPLLQSSATQRRYRFCQHCQRHAFAGLICEACAVRHERIPAKARNCSLAVATRRIERDPERYAVKAFASQFETRAIVALAADPVTGAGAVDVILAG